ncbi:hypothetical protein Y88_1470 [Novosphingobium nitrogenifigens DSM 19370]|uniref:Uncharacterized protein n=1 Tax=Novosphingobium nitrogenifigens DSM 19370 TaxID=983920 RepID=F1Z7C5_9SPHN|nr:hypothetical protein Y88_1470 [Novosphingobium nitrogenifigens DSM 19370]
MVVGPRRAHSIPVLELGTQGAMSVCKSGMSPTVGHRGPRLGKGESISSVEN